MDERQLEMVHFGQQKRIRSFSIDREELQQLLNTLQERSYAAAEIEMQSLKKNDEQTEEEFEAVKREIRETFELFISLSGVDGRRLTGNISKIFNSPNFPEEVINVFFNTSVSFVARYNYTPQNIMKLFLDFRRPGIFNFSILPSQETQNESNFEIQGKDVTWVNGVFQEFFNYVKGKPSTLPWLHRHSVYDVLIWVAGFPLSFWICKKLSPFIENVFGGYSVFLKSALYLYLFVIALNLIRIAFLYARWIWPLTEFRSERSKSRKHKAILALLLSGLVFPALYDLLKWLI